MRAFRRLAFAAISAASLTITLSGGIASADAPVPSAPVTHDPPSGGTPWSDCLYEHPQPSSDAYVNSFGNTHLNVGVTLRCGSHDRPGKTGFGVRHIKDGHGFNEYTEYCIKLVVMKARSLSPGSGQNNQVLKYGKDGVTGVVVFDVNHKNVVTAYTQGSGGDGNWHGCTSKLA